MMQPKKIENLVFEGGGSKGAAYAGSVAVLDELDLLSGVKQIAGTSAGSITAAILATGGGSAGLTDAIEHTQFAKFLNDPWGILGDIKRSIFNYGLHTGHEFVRILKRLIQGFSGSAGLTFSELDQRVQQNPDRFKHLSIVTSNLTRQSPQVFDLASSPDLPIWQAVRASMSIPLIFEPVKITGEYHVDGGLAWNYPIDLFDKTHSSAHSLEWVRDFNPNTLGFYLEPQALVPDGKKFQIHNYPIKSLKTYAEGLANYLYTTANSKHMHPEDRKRTVFIDDLGVSGTDFKISQECITALVESGRKAAEAYFNQESHASKSTNAG